MPNTAHIARFACILGCILGTHALPGAEYAAPSAARMPEKIIDYGGGGWKDGQVQEPCTLGLWYMFYSYRNESKTLPGIRLATSRDGKRWTKIAGPDLLTSAPEQRYIEWHQVYKIGNRYVMLYEGYNGGIRWGAAGGDGLKPDDGLEKSPRKPVRPDEMVELLGRRHVPRCHAGNLQDQQQVADVLYRCSFGAGLYSATLGDVVYRVQ